MPMTPYEELLTTAKNAAAAIRDVGKTSPKQSERLPALMAALQAVERMEQAIERAEREGLEGDRTVG